MGEFASLNHYNRKRRKRGLIEKKMILELYTLIPAILLFFGLFWSIAYPDTSYRRKILLALSTISLIFNTFNLTIFILFNLQSTDFYMNLNSGTILALEIILGLGYIALNFSKDEIRGFSNEHIFDSLLLVIILCLIGAAVTTNLVAITAFFAIILISLSIIFYFGHYLKPYELLAQFYIMIFIGITCVLVGVILTFLETNSLLLTEIAEAEFNAFTRLIISLLFFIGLGLPCGILPFTLKRYYQDASFTAFFTYALLVIPQFTLILNKLLVKISFDSFLNSLFIVIIATIGLIICLIHTLTETFTSLDGRSYSIKKIIGYSINSDFNIVLLTSAYIGLLPSDLLSTELWNYTFLFVFIFVFVKALLIYSLKPVVIETLDDNIKVLGGFFKNYKVFGISYLISGLLFSVPFMLGSMLLDLVLPITTNSVLNLPHISFIGFTIVTIIVCYFIITLIWISITFNDIFFGTEKHFKHKEVRKINKVDYIPQIILLGFIAFLCLFYLLSSDLFLQILNYFNQNFIS